jgi:prophage regulatory protein
MAKQVLPITPSHLTIIRARETARMVGCSVSHLWRMAQQGRFVRPVKCGPMMTGWVLSEVQDWIAARIAERDSQAPSGKAA